jgi:hypothetical protein
MAIGKNGNIVYHAVREGERPRSSSQLAQIIRTYADECLALDKIRKKNHVRLSLSARLISRGTVFFSHSKSATAGL